MTIPQVVFVGAYCAVAGFGLGMLYFVWKQWPVAVDCGKRIGRCEGRIEMLDELEARRKRDFSRRLEIEALEMGIAFNAPGGDV